MYVATRTCTFACTCSEVIKLLVIIDLCILHKYFVGAHTALIYLEPFHIQCTSRHVRTHAPRSSPLLVMIDLAFSHDFAFLFWLVQPLPLNQAICLACLKSHTKVCHLDNSTPNQLPLGTLLLLAITSCPEQESIKISTCSSFGRQSSTKMCP